jgi:Polyphosphate kinase 2 (PPK2)
VSGGIQLIKFWLEVGNQEQARRFEARIADPLRQWKLSPTDLESRRRWYNYSRARDRMLEVTDTAQAPWYIVPSDNKRRARLNCMAHLLSLIPYDTVPRQGGRPPCASPSRRMTTRRRCGADGLCRKGTEIITERSMAGEVLPGPQPTRGGGPDQEQEGHGESCCSSWLSS